MPSTTQKRTRDKVPVNGTLHNFFVRTATPTQPQWGLQTSAISRKAAKEQIIVIDSDSDDEIEIVKNTSSKRRKFSPTNSHLNGLREEDLLQGNDSTNQISINWKESSLPRISNTKEESHDSNKITFGKPFLLCSSSMDNIDGHPNSDCGARLFTSRSSLLGTTGSCSRLNVDLTLDDGNKDGDEVLVASTKAEIPSGADVSIALNGSSEGWDVEFISDDEGPQILFDDEEAVVNAALVSDQLSEKSGNAKATDAFSVLMSSLKEKEAWREADIAEDKTLRTHPTYARRKAPFYKVLQGMPIAVDAFRYGAIPGVTAYFLSHAHSDHYTTLSSSWKNGPIYCSEGTANLITHMLNVNKKWIRPLPMDTPILVPDTNGVTVTLIEANHCPGSCLFFFEGPQSVNSGDSNFKSAHVGSSRIFRYLHCGDFRASPQHVLHPALQGKTVDHVYLDTTYLDPRYTFPPQPLVISACAELARRIIEGDHTSRHGSSMLSWITSVSALGKEKVQARTLIVVGTYSIGKERLVKAIAHAVNSKIYCDVRKTAILRCEADPELDVLLTSDPKESFVHLIPLQTISTDCLKTYLQRCQGIYDRVIGFRPTGWTYSHPGADLSPSIAAILTKASEQNFSYSDLQVSPKSTPTVQLYPVPYSEHSSFSELTCFAMSFSWVKMIATVNVGNESSRAKMAKWVAKWEAERKKREKNAIVPHRHSDYW